MFMEQVPKLTYRCDNCRREVDLQLRSQDLNHNCAGTDSHFDIPDSIGELILVER